MKRAAMQFNKESILDLSIDDLSWSDKQYLIEKYFPETEPDWKIVLRDQWTQAQDTSLWNAYEGEGDYGESGEPCRYGHNLVRDLAATNPPDNPGHTVTSFTKWIMSLYLDAPNPRQLRRGKIVERSIAKLARPSQNPNWEIIYCDPLEKKPTPLKISSLAVNDSALWGAPDVVYKSKAQSQIIIVERKATDYPIPSDGWPNLRAQLWAYSKIDEFQQYRKITLIGEVWGSEGGKLRRRKVLRWNGDDTELNTQNSEFFKMYGGHILA